MTEARVEQGNRQGRNGGTVRLLGRDDLASTIRILSTNPVENVFVASRVRSSGMERNSLGCPMWGFERGGVLRSICHAGYNLVPVNADGEAVAAFAAFAGRDRMGSPLFGPSAVGRDFW